MTHDPLCPCESHKQPHIQHLNGVCHYCQCDLIAQVRADESAKYALIDLAKSDDRATVISLPRGGEHVDWCRDLACYGCEEIADGVIAQKV